MIEDTIYNLGIRSQQINECANTDIYEDLEKEKIVTTKCVDICRKKLSILQGVLDGVGCLSTRQAGDAKSNGETMPPWKPGGPSVFRVGKAITKNGSDQVIVNAQGPRPELLGYFKGKAFFEAVDLHYR
jgi:hypothetical protein